MSQPVSHRTVGGYDFTWPDVPVRVIVRRIRDSSSRGPSAEVQIQVTEEGRTRTIAHQSLALLANKARLSAALERRYPAPWASMLEQVCILLLRDLRQGEPVESLTPAEDTEVTQFVLNPLVYDRNMTVLYGPGDSMKSLFTLYCALLLANGCSENGLYCSPEPWRVLYLDYEMSLEDCRSRVRLLQRAHPPLVAAPDYRRCVRPIADDVEALKGVVTDGAYQILIVDSLAMAAGGAELDKAEAATLFVSAMRTLGCASLVIGHTPKPQADEHGARSIYGSVFFYNLCRVAWEVRRSDDVIALLNRKNNLGRRPAPLGFRLEVNAEQCLVTQATLHDEPELAPHMPLLDRLLHALQHNSATVAQLAERFEVAPQIIERLLRRHPTLFLEDGEQWFCCA